MNSRDDSRERRLQRKREISSVEILDAAAVAFSQRGYAATSIDDIADVLGCTKGRVYYYFKTKSDVFVGINRRALVWALEAIEPPATEPGLRPDQRLREMTRRHAIHMMVHSHYTGPAQFHTEMNLAREGVTKGDEVAEIFAMRRRFEEHFVRVIRDGIEDGVFRPGDPELLAKALLGSFNWMSIWFRPGSSFDTPAERDRVATEFSEFAVNGVLATASRSRRRTVKSAST